MLDFPNTPVNNQIFVGSNGVTYKYQTTPGIWVVASSDDAGDIFDGVFNVLQFGASGTGNVAVDALAFQAAANAARDAGGGVVLVPSGLYIISTPVTLSSGTTVDGFGESSHIIADAALSLTQAVFMNANRAVTAAFQRNDRDIVIKNIKFDGSQRPYPKYLVTSGGVPVANPATDPTRATGYNVSGYMIQFVHGINCVVEDCIFVQHQSFCICFNGCLQSGTRRNYFENCGRIDYSSNCIFIGHSGTAASVTAVTQGATTVLTLNVNTPGITSNPTCTLFQIGGLLSSVGVPVLPNGVYPISSFVASPPTITLAVDSSAATSFVMDGRAWIGTEFFTPSENCFSEDDRGQDLKRALVQVGLAAGVNVVSPIIRNGMECGVFVTQACDVTISNANFDNIDIADIVSSGIEINYGANIKLVSPTLRRSRSYALTVVGCVGLDISDMTIDEPQNHLPTYTTPYGPFNEAGGVTGSLATTASSTAATTSTLSGTVLVGMVVVSPNVPANTKVTNVSGATVTLSVAATGTATSAVRFNPVEGPGIALPFFQRYAVSFTASGYFPIENWSIKGGRLTTDNRQLSGGFLFTKTGTGAGADSIRSGEIRHFDFRKVGPRGKVSGVSLAASAVITTAKPHGLVASDTVYIAGVTGTVAVNNPVVIVTLTTTAASPTATVSSGTGIAIGATIVSPAVPSGTTVSNIVGTTVTMSANATATLVSPLARFDKRYGITVLSPTTFRILVDTSASPPFTDSGFGRWATYDPDKDFDWTSGNGTDLASVSINDCGGTRYSGTYLA